MFRAAAVLAVGLAGFAIGDVAAKSVECEGKKYIYELHIPRNAGENALPAILLLHGAGDSPEPMIRAWQELADKVGVVLVAPELPRKREFEAVAPQVFRCVMEEAKNAAKLDPLRLYVFGNSMGGYLAYDAAMFDSDYFAAVGVHAMGIDPEYDGILSKAKRKTPIAIYMGDRDPLVSLANVRRTRELLERNGFPVRYREIRGHDHNFYVVREEVRGDVWKFFQQHPLEAAK